MCITLISPNLEGNCITYMIKESFKSIIKQLVSSNVIWKLMEYCFVRPVEYARITRNALVSASAFENRSVEERILERLASLTVLRGPFEGLKYPEAKSIGSVIAPKLLGFYEYELQTLISARCIGKYRTIVDIGCAEGYYAIGLGLQNPEAIVYAFDTDFQAVAQCGKMALVNEIGERVLTGASCTPKTLMSLELRSPCLIVCDCEGYEKELFNEELVEKLSSSELLIELHDMVDDEIPAYIESLFHATHHSQSVFSERDDKKVEECQCEELSGFSRDDRISILSERRSRQMQWVFLSPRNSGL